MKQFALTKKFCIAKCFECISLDKTSKFLFLYRTVTHLNIDVIVIFLIFKFLLSNLLHTKVAAKILKCGNHLLSV